MLHGTDILLDMIAGRAHAAGPVLPAKTASSEFPALSGVLLASMCKRATARPQHPQFVSLPGLLRASLHKQAQVFDALGEASKQQHPYVKSVANMNAKRQRDAQAAAARRNAPVRGMTGDTEYDNLPDVKRRRLYENMERQKQEYLKSRQDLIQRKDQATIQKEMGPVKSWGDSQIGRTMVRGISDAAHTVAGIGGSAWLAASRLWDKSRRGTSFMDEQREYWKNHNEARDDVTHDTLNNYQIFANSAANGAGTVARGLNYGAHKVLGASEDKLYSLNNEWDNANDAHKAKMDALQGQFRDKSLSDPNSTFGKINRFTMEQSGKLLGETAAMGAVGGTLGQVGRGIQAGSRALSGIVRGTHAASAGARVAGWGARAVQGARNMTAKGIETMGNTVAAPFNAASAALNPVNHAKVMGRAASGAWSVARHPVNSFRAARSAVAHPWQTAQAGWRAMGGSKGLDKGYQLWQGTDALYNIGQGNFGDAAAAVGDMGLYGALGKWSLPYVGYQMYRGFSDAQEPYDTYDQGGY